MHVVVHDEPAGPARLLPWRWRSAAGAVVLLTGLMGCGSSSGSNADGATPTGATTVATFPATSSPATSSPADPGPPATTATKDPTTTVAASTTSTVPLDFAGALLARFTTELGDAALAAQLVNALGPDTLGKLESAAGTDGAASPLLAISPPTVPLADVDSLVVYAFGNRVAADGTLSPGPTNEALAATVESVVAQHPVPVYAQWEVADLLTAKGVPGVVSIGRDVAADGTVTYLSTAGVAAKAVALAAEGGTELGHVGVIGFADHAVRCVLTSRAAGMTADVPEGVGLPSTYDPESGQGWTRDRLTYLGVDLPARLAVAG